MSPVPLVGVRLVQEGRVPARGRSTIRGPRDAAHFVRETIGTYDREAFVVLMLDAGNRVLGVHRAAVGSLTSCQIEPRGVLTAALLAGAAAIIVGHNHPSGDPAPSPDDRRVTARLVAAADTVGIPLLDHIIVGDEGRHASLHDLGMMVKGMVMLKGEGRT